MSKPNFQFPLKANTSENLVSLRLADHLANCMLAPPIAQQKKGRRWSMSHLIWRI
jgi:hypothetical protein